VIGRGMGSEDDKPLSLPPPLVLEALNDENGNGADSQPGDGDLETSSQGKASTGGKITATDIKQAMAQGVVRSSRQRLFAHSSKLGNGFTATGSSVFVNVNDVLDARHGSALDNRSILKIDYVPKDHVDKEQLFPVNINGTSNLRQSPTTQVFGTAQPTIAGIRGVLNLLGASRNTSLGAEENPANMRRSVLWINLREEPTLYINGRSTVLRERHEPFQNIDQLQGIDPTRIHDLEKRLKEEVVEEAARYNGNLVLHEEFRRRELEASWEAVTMDDIRSPDEVFFTFRMQGYRVEYVRIPTTPEKSPSPQFFDNLVRCFMKASSQTTIIFNCQTGVSRSTIGMVAGGLVQMWRGLINIPKSLPQGLVTSNSKASPTDQKQNRDTVVRVLSGLALASYEDGLEMQTLRRLGSEASSNDTTSRQLEAGWYQPTLALLRLIESGREAKKHVDFFCEDASHLVNLRQIIFLQRSRASHERHEQPGKIKAKRAAIALLRYLTLITFDAYLASQVKAVLKRDSAPGPSPSAVHFSKGNFKALSYKHDADKQRPFPQTFLEWLHARPEIINLFKLVEKRPMQALEALDLNSSLGLEEGTESVERKAMRDAMQSRRGSMLNTDTILKADHFPGGFVERNAQDIGGVSIRGAPNFRNVEGTTVYGVSTPTRDGVEAILRYIQTATTAKKIVWTNLREEPVLYINKKPFVLRSVKQPFRNVNEFIMINPERLEAAELRLKQDILEEARRYDGRIVLHSEADDRSIQLFWQDISEEDVLTPREMYQSMVEAGLPVDYQRVPLTPEQPPTPVDIDALLNRVREYKASQGVHFVFNCQLGRGRSTTAMAVALLELQRPEDPKSEFFEDMMAFGQKFDYQTPGDESAMRPPQIRLPSSTMVASTPNAKKSGFSGGYMSSEDEEDGTKHLIASTSLRCQTPPRPSRRNSFGSDGDASDTQSTYSEDFDGNTPSYNASDDEFGVILSLVRVLSKGVVARKWADLVVDECGEVEHLRKKILENAERATTARSIERSQEFIERGLLSLKRFYFIVLVAAYEINYVTDGKMSFSKWYFKRPELTTILNEIQGKQSLRYASFDKVLSSGPPPSEANELAAAEGPSAQEASNGKEDDSMKSIYQFVGRRNGMVLTRGSILKSDHFPGCQRLKNAKVSIEGAPNYREIWTAKESDDNVGIYGTGIPTVEGLRGILRDVSAKRQTMVCINLREEPILYVNGRPFVLRKLEHPFENLEHTGISRSRVEEMEARLKVDCLNEVIAGNGRLLIHDEDESGVQALWSQVNISEGSTSIQTPKDLYEMLAQEFDVSYVRVPITDEQAPKVVDYDTISQIVRNAPLDAALIFNCQMGRGRTTTGLVVATSIRLWERGELHTFPAKLEELVSSGHIVTKRLSGSKDIDETKRMFLQGSYEAIGGLTRVLDSGVSSKRTLDAVIDSCDALQNLREAIYGLKEVVDSEDKTPAKRAAALNRGIHYLSRYYQLVEFVDYLFCTSPEDRTQISTFASWLARRRELKSILKRITLD